MTWVLCLTEECGRTFQEDQAQYWPLLEWHQPRTVAGQGNMGGPWGPQVAKVQKQLWRYIFDIVVIDVICYILLKIKVPQCLIIHLNIENVLHWVKSRQSISHYVITFVCERIFFSLKRSRQVSRSIAIIFYERRSLDIINLSLVAIIEEHMVWYQHFINAIEKDFKYYEANF